LKQQREKDKQQNRQEPFYPGSRREQRSRRFAERWNAAKQVTDAGVAAYIESGQAAIDQREAREASALHEFDLRQKATSTQRPRRARARGAGRPAGRRVVRRASSSSDDSDSDSSDESDDVEAALVCARRACA
jgi:hypothetical protein